VLFLGLGLSIFPLEFFLPMLLAVTILVHETRQRVEKSIRMFENDLAQLLIIFNFCYKTILNQDAFKNQKVLYFHFI